MSRKNRLRLYNKLVTDNEIWKDDGSLAKEFGQERPIPAETLQDEAEKKKTVKATKKKKVKKHG